MNVSHERADPAVRKGPADGDGSLAPGPTGVGSPARCSRGASSSRRSGSSSGPRSTTFGPGHARLGPDGVPQVPALQVGSRLRAVPVLESVRLRRPPVVGGHRERHDHRLALAPFLSLRAAADRAARSRSSVRRSSPPPARGCSRGASPGARRSARFAAPSSWSTDAGPCRPPRATPGTSTTRGRPGRSTSSIAPAAAAIDPRAAPPAVRWRDVVLCGACIAMMVYTGAIYPLPQTILALGLWSILLAVSYRTIRPVARRHRERRRRLRALRAEAHSGARRRPQVPAPRRVDRDARPPRLRRDLHVARSELRARAPRRSTLTDGTSGASTSGGSRSSPCSPGAFLGPQPARAAAQGRGAGPRDPRLRRVPRVRAVDAAAPCAHLQVAARPVALAVPGDARPRARLRVDARARADAAPGPASGSPRSSFWLARRGSRWTSRAWRACRWRRCSALTCRRSRSTPPSFTPRRK